MDPKKTIEIMQTLLNQLSSELQSLDSVPRTGEDVEALLMELAAAAQDRADHFKRFPRSETPEIYQISQECKDDWARVLQRHDKAVANLVAYGRVLLLKAST